MKNSPRRESKQASHSKEKARQAPHSSNRDEWRLHGIISSCVFPKTREGGELNDHDF